MNEKPIRHETRDIHLRPIGWIVVAFIVVAIVIHVAVWWIFQYYRDLEGRRDVRRSMVEGGEVLPKEPRLQLSPQQDWDEFYASQQKILNSYEWLSREEGRVRIPIERAMELLVERGGVANEK